MVKTQLNIKIPVDLLSKVKSRARVRGKTVTQFIIDLVNESLLDQVQPIIKESVQYSDIESRLKIIESTLESISIRYEKPFTSSEAIRVSTFLKNVFNDAIIKKGFKTKKASWNDFIEYLEFNHDINKIYMLRLKEILLMDEPDFFTVDELNDPSNSEDSLFEIVSALTKWAGIINCPSLSYIRNHGDEIMSWK